MGSLDEIRIDKWLWAVRLYKTRTLAAEACRAGHVKVAGQPVKASRDVRIGDVISVYRDELTRTLRVLGLLTQRVGASRLPEYLEDLTPESEYQKQRERAAQRQQFQREGAARPTKRERRALEKFLSRPPG